MMKNKPPERPKFPIIGDYQSIYGLIKSGWKKDASGFKLQVLIPVNTTAEIWLPAKENVLITEGGKSISSLNEIKLLKYEKGYAVFAAGSGEYEFLAKNK